jgi:hypothetical protein
MSLEKRHFPQDESQALAEAPKALVLDSSKAATQ